MQNSSNSNLLIAVLGHRNSGKSRTWNTLFDRTVKTGNKERSLHLYDNQCTNVYLVSGSAEERQEYVGNLIKVENPRIVLCSIQYIEEGMQTFDYFAEHNYSLFIHWLNPGYHDQKHYEDYLQFVPRLLQGQSMLGIRSGKIKPDTRVDEIRSYIYGWAKSRGLVYTCQN